MDVDAADAEKLLQECFQQFPYGASGLQRFACTVLWAGSKEGFLPLQAPP